MLNNVRAELKRLHSPDVHDLRTYKPENDHNFGLLLQLMVGPYGESGAESFDVLLCTPEWLKQHNKASDLVWGRHLLIVFKYDHDRLFHFLQEYCAQCSGNTWKEIAEKLGRVAKWEFEDYKSAVS